MIWYLALLYLASILGIFEVGHIGSYGITPIEAVLMGVVPIFLYRCCWQGRPVRVPATIEVAATGLFLLTFLIANLAPVFSGDYAMLLQSIKTTVHFVYIVGLFFLLLCMDIEPSTWLRGLRIHAIIGFYVCLFAIYQLVARGMDLPFGWIEVTNTTFQDGDAHSFGVGQLALKFANFYRATSIFSEPSALAAYGAHILAVMAVPMAARMPSIFGSRSITILALATTFLALFLAFSMTGLVLVCGLIGLLVLLYHRVVVRSLVIGLVAGVLIIGATDRIVEATSGVSVLELFGVRVLSYLTGTAMKDDVGSIIGESASLRANDFTVSTMIWSEQPILGVGPGNFEHSHLGRSYLTKHTNSTYAGHMAEYGAVGTIGLAFFFVSIVVSSVVLAWRRQRYGPPEQSPAVTTLGAVAPFVAVLLVLQSLSGNILIAGQTWCWLLPLYVGTDWMRREQGRQPVDFLLVRRPWRDRLHEAYRSRTIRSDVHGSHH